MWSNEGGEGAATTAYFESMALEMWLNVREGPLVVVSCGLELIEPDILRTFWKAILGSLH